MITKLRKKLILSKQIDSAFKPVFSIDYLVSFNPIIQKAELFQDPPAVYDFKRNSAVINPRFVTSSYLDQMIRGDFTDTDWMKEFMLHATAHPEVQEEYQLELQIHIRSNRDGQPAFKLSDLQDPHDYEGHKLQQEEDFMDKLNDHFDQ